MLSFEEFFTKKKIDLSALKSVDLQLYSEFKAHYSAMGEKSFDHSKKFWFNKLRKDYLLVEPTNVSKERNLSESIQPAVPSMEQAASPLDFTSKIKPQRPVSEKPKENDEAKEPTSFKPRFKAGVTKTSEQADHKTEQDISNASISTEEYLNEPNSKVAETTSKPAGFKPRFKAGVTKTSEQPDPKTAEDMSNASISTEESPNEPDNKAAETTSKPAGFKPRFKAGITKTSEQPDPKTAEDISNASISTEESRNKSDSKTAETTSKPAGFKPRFKAGVTKTSEQPDPKTAEDISNASISTEESPNESDSKAAETTSKPAGFKPRFKAGVTKNAPPTDNKEQ